MAPGSAEGRINYGLALLQSGEFEAARSQLDQAVALDARNPASHRLLGLALEGTGDKPRALQSYRRSVQLLPAQPVVLERIQALEDV